MIKKQLEIMLELILVTVGYGILAFGLSLWGWTCDYMVHGTNDRFQDVKGIDIVMGWISVIILQIVFGLFIFLASLPMLNYPWKPAPGVDSSCCRRSMIVTIALFILSLSYPAMYSIEIYLLRVDNSPGMWTSVGVMYAVSAYLKILPLYMILYKYKQYLGSDDNTATDTAIKSTTAKTRQSSSVAPEEQI